MPTHPRGAQRSRATTPATVAGLVALAAAVAGLSACTDDPDPTTPSGSSTTASASPTPTPTGPFTGTDQSALVLAAPLPTVKGTTKGTLDRDPATLNVADVRATAGGTLLTFWYTGEDTMLIRRGEYGWTNWPTLVDTKAKKVYEPLTYVNEQGDTACLCTDGAYIRGVPQPRTVLYPPVPDTVTVIQVHQTGFSKPVTINVTRPS